MGLERERDSLTLAKGKAEIDSERCLGKEGKKEKERDRERELN